MPAETAIMTGYLNCITMYLWFIKFGLFYVQHKNFHKLLNIKTQTEVNQNEEGHNT